MATGPGCFYGENVNPSGNRKDENGNPSPKEIIFGRKHPAYSTSITSALLEDYTKGCQTSDTATT